MINKEYNLQYDKLCSAIGLGELLSVPSQLTGGHLNRMYRLHTSSGDFAVKAINPQVMQRPEAKQNYINSERITQIAAKNLPALPAKIFDGEFLIEIDGQYYLVFDFVDGRTILHDELTSEHCRIMGKILCELHTTDFSSLGLTDSYSCDEKSVDWASYLEKGKETNAEWVSLIESNFDNLIEWNKLLIATSDKLSGNTVISHCDLEPKNVMWQGSSPILSTGKRQGLSIPCRT